MSALQHASSDTHEQTCSYTPIAGLPVELLVRIFAFVATLDPLPTSQDALSRRTKRSHTPCSRLAWVNLTHVCQRWRQVALGDAGLWARAIGMMPRRSKTFLKRAGDSAPLSFFITPKRFELVKILVEQVNRVESIIWRDYRWANHRDPNQDLELIDRTLGGCSFDTLKRLDVRTRYLLLLHKPEPLRADMLESATFIGHYVPFIAPRLVDLTLEVLNSRADGDKVLELLRTCPLIKRLELVGHDCTRFPLMLQLPTWDPPVRLAHLRQLKLRLSMAARKMVLFLDCLDFPTTAEICVRKARFEEGEDYVIFQRVFAASDIEDEATLLELNDHIMSLSTTSLPNIVKLSINVGNLSVFAHVLQHIGVLWSFATQLRVCPSKFANQEFWELIFRPLWNVHRLEITYNKRHPRLRCDTILHALAPPISSGPPERPLRSLRILRVDKDVLMRALSLENDILHCIYERLCSGIRPLTVADLRGFARSEAGGEELERIIDGPVMWKDTFDSKLTALHQDSLSADELYLAVLKGCKVAPVS